MGHVPEPASAAGAASALDSAGAAAYFAAAVVGALFAAVQPDKALTAIAAVIIAANTCLFFIVTLPLFGIGFH